MHALKRLIFICLAAFPLLAHDQNLNDNYRIVLTINGQIVTGAQERALNAAGKTPDQIAAIYDAEPPIPIAAGQVFQAVVTITDPSGVTQDLTQSPRLTYNGFGCLTISPLGVVTVTPVTGARCDGPDFPELWISYNDASGTPIAMNAYLFHVNP